MLAETKDPGALWQSATGAKRQTPAADQSCGSRAKHSAPAAETKAAGGVIPCPIRDGRRPVVRWLSRRLHLLTPRERLAVLNLLPGGAAGETFEAFARVTGWPDGTAGGRA